MIVELDNAPRDGETQLGALVARVEAGETLLIARDGRPVAELRPLASATPRRRLDIEALRRHLDTMVATRVAKGLPPFEDDDGISVVEQMRRDARY